MSKVKYHGVKVWNSLSPELRIQSFESFKINMKNHLLDNYSTSNSETLSPLLRSLFNVIVFEEPHGNCSLNLWVAA